MRTTIPAGPYTFDDFCSIIADGQKADLIDGVIYLASPENTDANDLFMWLGGLIYDFVIKKKLGRVFGSRVAFRLGDRNGPEPDIAFVSKKHLHRVMRGHVVGPPDLAVEIVSPDSVERDYKKKRRQYQQARVREYWIVDEILRKVTLLRLTAQGQYREARAKQGILRSHVLTGFWIRPGWFWQIPLPDRIDILNDILSKP